MSDDDICGEPTLEGEPCQRPAGWGRDEEGGPCQEHESDTPHPRKLSHTRQERIAADLESGISFKHACEANGISKDTGHRWLRLGEEQDEGPLSDFYDRVTRARGAGKRDLARSIVEIAKENNDPNALLRYLQEIEGGEQSQEDDLAGLNLVVPDVAKREQQ